MKFKPKISLTKKKKKLYVETFYPAQKASPGGSARSTWIVPDGVSSIMVEMLGGGGGGGRAATNYAGTTSTVLRKYAIASGGAGGMYLVAMFSVVPGQSIVLAPGGGGLGADVSISGRNTATGGNATYIDINWRNAGFESIAAHGGQPGLNQIRLSSPTTGNTAGTGFLAGGALTWNSSLGAYPGDTLVVPQQNESGYYGYVPYLGGTCLAFFGEAGTAGSFANTDTTSARQSTGYGGKNGLGFLYSFRNPLLYISIDTYGAGSNAVAPTPTTNGTNGQSSFAKGGEGGYRAGGGGQGGIARSVLLNPGIFSGTTASANGAGGDGGDGFIRITYSKYE